MKSNNKKTLVGAIIFVAFLILITFGLTYAFFARVYNQKEDDSSVDFTTAALNIDFKTSKWINNDNTHLINDSEAYQLAERSQFSVARSLSNSTKNVYYVIDLTNIVISDELKNSYFKWALYDTDSITESSVPVSSGDFSEINSDTMNLRSKIALPKDETHTYTLIAWLSMDPDVNQNSLLKGTFEGKIAITASNE